MKKFEGWAGVTLHDLLVAYRKAKADCFFEKTFPSAAKFASYEADLVGNLKLFLDQLRAGGEFSKIEGLLGEYRLIPKKLKTERKHDVENCGHVHFSNSKRNFENIKNSFDVIPDFRVIGDFPVEAHILSALWINFIGHKLDAKLSKACYGARLRRVRPDGDGAGNFHSRSIGSFPPYFQAYQKWRSDGLNAIRRELETDKHVIAVSLDLKSYYHTVDPGAISLPGLLDELGINLDAHEKEFNEQFSVFLKAWSDGAKSFCKILSVDSENLRGGLVIGLTASRVISNVIIAKWDRLIKEKLAPIHYGRYVDDMFLVVRDNGVVNSGPQFMQYLSRCLGDGVLKAPVADDSWKIDLGVDVVGESEIVLQANKQKLFVLQGNAGLDLLDSIEGEINALSSEHRLMPSPDDLERSTAARVLSAAGVVGDSADTLRRADGLTIRRLSWALQLRHVETLASDLPPVQWSEQRKQFYEFADSHILRPDTIFSHIDYVPRLLGFAVSMSEWADAKRIALRSYDSFTELAAAVPEGAAVVINGVSTISSAVLWGAARRALTMHFSDALMRFISPKVLISDRKFSERSLLEIFALEHSQEGVSDLEDGLDIGYGFRDVAKSVARSDLAKVPFKKIMFGKFSSKMIESIPEDQESQLLDELNDSSVFDVEALKEFLSSVEQSGKKRKFDGPDEQESILPYVFPTRPLTPAEITELAPECVDPNLARAAGRTPSQIWARYTRALRGVWVRPTLLADDVDADDAGSKRWKRFTRIGTSRKDKVVVALPSVETADNDWAAMACGSGSLSRSRYKAISEIVNKAISLKDRPDYLIFPELCLPIEWVESVSSRLGDAGISLIAGTEYRHVSKNVVYSEACLVLSDDRMGFPSFSRIWQPKLEPAVNEDKELQAIHGKRWKNFNRSRFPASKARTVYIHNGVNFGIMVCSELQNSRARISFQGAVDALFVLCWNPDLDTFSSLVESAALDIHAYTVLVNNRKYGDSRIRVPAKKSFDRDLARVRGGDNDFLVAATLEISTLRKFQSRSKRWPGAQDKFKPVPEGFKLAKSRRRFPAG
ncbi:RNA-directed DNA polymerase [uncultured Stenotrophomonas sp.]|uniref:RNA-directed DNA polymerase n=1 Tax=uncultured Stenotrophomonas sp. TaxID=165438 RepID=UPI0025FA4B61|nr:RNA-directed DNA polymerase [uncultured Stenotrophomonas sp.]